MHGKEETAGGLKGGGSFHANGMEGEERRVNTEDVRSRAGNPLVNVKLNRILDDAWIPTLREKRGGQGGRWAREVWRLIGVR